jgi:hypothetical protein
VLLPVESTNITAIFEHSEKPIFLVVRQSRTTKNIGFWEA